MALNCNILETPEGVIVEVQGDIDFSRSPEMRNKLMQVLGKAPAKLIINLAGVNYMDSSGVATLVEALQVQRKNSRKLVLAGLQPKVKGIFEIARLNMVFTITPDVETAKKA